MRTALFAEYATALVSLYYGLTHGFIAGFSAFGLFLIGWFMLLSTATPDAIKPKHKGSARLFE